MRFSDDGKRVDIALISEGLYWGGAIGKTEEDRRESLEKAKKSLADFVASEQQFRLPSQVVPIFNEVDLRPAENGEQANADNEAWKKSLSRVLDIRNEAFFLNDRNELSTYQTITFDTRQFEDTVNALIASLVDQGVTQLLATPRDDTGWSGPGDASLRMLQRAARKGHKWLSIGIGEVTVSVPMTNEDAQKEVARFSTDETFEKTAIDLKKSYGTFTAKAVGDGLIVVIGDGKKRTFVFEETQSTEDNVYPFEGDLLIYARSLRIPFDRGLDTKSLVGKHTEP